MLEYTREPWLLHGQEIGVEKPGGTYAVVAKTSANEGNTTRAFAISASEADQNAALIAQAPALYEACRDYLAALDGYKPAGVVNDAIDRMRAAVKGASS